MNETSMATYPFLALLCLLTALSILPAGCSTYSDYQSNMTYVNNDLLSQEEALARDQLRAARAGYEAALRAGPVTPGAEVEKTFMEAREKYLIIQKEKILRQGRVPTTKDLTSDPELAIPTPPSGSKPGSGARPAPTDAPDAGASTTPAPTSDAAPGQTAPPAAAPGTPAPAAGPTAASGEATTYTVQKGDTLGAIAKRHNVPVTELVAVNSLQSVDKIATGQVLKIPQH